MATPVSGDTLIRRVTARPREPETPVRCLGIDDFAFRKGQHYGTILIDLERGRVVDLLKSREAADVEAWLKAHPGVEIITRDRASEYAIAATNGAPEATQVADRWHLLKNVREAIERLRNRRHKAVKACLKERLPSKPESDFPTFPGDSEIPETEPIPPTAREESREGKRQQRVDVYNRVHELHRVSTERQGQSGLGLESQRAAVLQFVAGRGTLIGEFTEIETGRRGDRPEIQKALAHAKRTRATLVIAKLDRLARNVAFVSSLMESSVDFQACDNPHANRLTIHILAAVAEDEARRISERTKAALAAYKARGGKLGTHDPRCKPLSLVASQRGSAAAKSVISRQTREAYADLLPLVLELRGAGRSLRKIAAELNRLGHTTRNGKGWNAVQVGRILALVGGRE